MKTLASVRLLATIGLLAALAGCGGGGGVCTWPALYDPQDGAVGMCRAAAYALSCKGSDGGGEECLSNDLTACPGEDPIVGVTYGSCHNLCKSNEYAMTCGAIAQAPPEPAPTRCRLLPPNPGGIELLCCPCDWRAP